MQIARVQGRATCTVRHKSLAAVRLLVCQPLDSAGKDAGDPVLVLDKIGAGGNDRVVITSDGLGLRDMLKDETSPARWWTLGIVD
jgi:microcompartment protein CcmK/EutM